ncbi:MAG: phosphoribosylglycinamide formyltransferase [Pseudomonadota bacterium]
MTARKRVGVLISGRGSNMVSLAHAAQADDYPAEIAIVASNVPDAPGLARAREFGIKTATVDHKLFDDRAGFERALHMVLKDANIDLLCNAGFLRLLTKDFVDAWLDRQLNIHPSLLPAYKGLHTHERVIADGTRISGATVHFVRTEMDAGPIVAQAAVPVLSNDSADTLAARVLDAEHALYPHALALVAGGKARVVDERVVHAGDATTSASLMSPQLLVPNAG